MGPTSSIHSKQFFHLQVSSTHPPISPTLKANLHSTEASEDAAGGYFNALNKEKRGLLEISLADPSHRPYFSAFMPEEWLLLSGYKLYEHWKLANPDGLVDSPPKRKDLLITRNFVNDPYFSLNNANEWICPVAFEAWLQWYRHAVSPQEKEDIYSRPSSRMSITTNAETLASRPSSRLSMLSKALRPSSCMSDLSEASQPLSRMSISEYSFWGASSPPHSMYSSGNASVGGHQESPIKILDSNDELGFPSSFPKSEPLDSIFLSPKIEAKFDIKKAVKQEKQPFKLPTEEKEKAVAKPNDISKPLRLTAKMKVESLHTITNVPSTWLVPRRKEATLLDLTDKKLPDKGNGSKMTMDAFIRSQDQDSWKGSLGHGQGDVGVFGFANQGDVAVQCRRVELKCNGIKICEHFDNALLENCQRFEPDEQEMKAMFKQELNANETEAKSPVNIILRFYREAMNSKCDPALKCPGRPVLRRLQKPSTNMKTKCVGCLHWTYKEGCCHRYLAIPLNIDEDEFEELSSNPTCILMLHPLSGLKQCKYLHTINGVIQLSRIVPRPCSAKMTIYVPVDNTIQQAIVYIHKAQPHNHPMHCPHKPTFNDKEKVYNAMNMLGSRKASLTALKVRNAPLTVALYGGKPIAAESPAFMDTRRFCDVVRKEKIKDYPKGLDWEGVVYEHAERESKLAIKDRYIHTVLSTGNIKLVLTMNSRLAKLFHVVMYLAIDFTFKRVRGEIDEWEVTGFVERVAHRLTGSILKIVAFHPDDPLAIFRVFILDAETAQVLGLADALQLYILQLKHDDPGLPQDCIDVALRVLKTCSVHFDQNIDKLPKSISQDIINRLKSWKALKNDQEVASWHEFCKNMKDESLISAHAFTNDATGIQTPLLETILSARELDNKIADELDLIEDIGILPNPLNGPVDQEHRSTQRQNWASQKANTRNQHLSQHNALISEQTKSSKTLKASMAMENELTTKLKTLRESFKQEKRPSTYDKIQHLTNAINKEKQLCRDLRIWQKEIDGQLHALKHDGLAGPFNQLPSDSHPTSGLKNMTEAELSTDAKLIPPSDTAATLNPDLDYNCLDYDWENFDWDSFDFSTVDVQAISTKNPWPFPVNF
ncbi:hypothetical protein B0H34DRAFT_675602 [Crassisporium funariophilum]|nr:hypothetical protein B0H34DRAFT_675602 [Crassisporium funariophilum]